MRFSGENSIRRNHHAVFRAQHRNKYTILYGLFVMLLYAVFRAQHRNKYTILYESPDSDKTVEYGL